MIVDIKEGLGIASFMDSFAAEYPLEKINQNDENKNENKEQQKKECNQKRHPRTQGHQVYDTLM